MTIGIIPAAGRGVRSGLPYAKELLPVKAENGKVITVIEGTIQQLSNAEVPEAIIVIRPEKQMIADYLGQERFGVRLEYRYQETMHSREGLPDAVLAGINDAEMNIMLMGDTYFTHPFCVYNLLRTMQYREEAIAGVGTWQTHEPERFGIVQYYNELRWVRSVVDKPAHLPKPQPHWGCVAFRPAFWKYLKEERETFSHALNRAAQNERVTHEPMDGEYLDFGNPDAIIDGIKVANE